NRRKEEIHIIIYIRERRYYSDKRNSVERRERGARNRLFVSFFSCKTSSLGNNFFISFSATLLFRHTNK
ncbi:hypothetical protein, partial [Prevotella bivia]|uniref:hypothetical protein n=1 Tax=Prevotella bivia TaxID=28125 RepID=UPI0019552E2E